MIQGFVHKGLEKFFYDGIIRGVQHSHAQKLADILDRLDASIAVKDMNYPGSYLHKLKGKKKDFWCVRVSGNWRVIFKFIDGHAYNIDYIDYH